MRFRKKPIEIEALRFRGPGPASADSITFEGDAMPAWVAAAHIKGDLEASHLEPTRGCWVHTKHGPVLMRPGDWLIRGLGGEVYPCDHETFTETYEAIP